MIYIYFINFRNDLHSDGQNYLIRGSDKVFLQMMDREEEILNQIIHTC